MSTIKGIFGSLLGGNKEGVTVGIDIGSSSIKVVQLKKERGRIVMDTYGEIALGPLVGKTIGEPITFDKEVIAKALKELLREANITSSNAIVSIHSNSSLIVIMEIPSTVETSNDTELNSVIKLEARKYIPVSMSEITLDWWMVPMLDSGLDKNGDKVEAKNEVLVAALRNQKLKEYEDILDIIEFKGNTKFEIEIFAAIRSSFRNELSSVVLVDIGAKSTRVAVVNYGVVRMFHSISKGSFDITQNIANKMEINLEKAEDLKKKIGMSAEEGTQFHDVSDISMNHIRMLFNEIKRVVLSYEKTYDKSVGKMILVGGGSRILGLEHFVEREFNIEIEMGDPFRKADTPKFLDRVLVETGPEFAVALGLALKPYI